jgi:hypothetical protein
MTTTAPQLAEGVTGSIQMSKPGSIPVSAEGNRTECALLVSMEADDSGGHVVLFETACSARKRVQPTLGTTPYVQDNQAKIDRRKNRAFCVWPVHH